MRPVLELLKREPGARPFFVAHVLSSLGTGAGYVALLLVAYERTGSVWALSLVLLADFLPSMALGPVFGAAADRWSRRKCAILADILRAVAFVGIGLLGGFWAMFGLAMLAGAGTGLFNPAVMAWLPDLVTAKRLPAGTALFGALADAGWMVGPALAAAAFLFAGPETVLIANGVSFAVSALLLFRLPEPGRIESDDGRDGRRSLLVEARDGMAAARRIAGVPTLLLAAAGGVLFAGALNLGELLLAQGELGAGTTGFSILVSVYGAGVVLGSLGGSSGGNPARLKRRFLAGLLLQGLAIAASGLAPVVAIALVTFALTGFGDGYMLVHERLLLLRTVPNEMMGRVFGLRDALNSWAFGGAFLSSSAVAALLGPRPLFLLAGGMCVVTWGIAAVALRGSWTQSAAGVAPHSSLTAAP